MAHYIVEHKVKGHYVMETIHGVEDIDCSRFNDLMGIWVCDTIEECNTMEKELKEMRNARPSKQP